MPAGDTDTTLTTFAPAWAGYQAKRSAARSRWLHDFMPADAAMLEELGGWGKTVRLRPHRAVARAECR